MRTRTSIAAAALGLAACAAPSTTVQPTPPVRHLDLAGLPEGPAHDHDTPRDAPAGTVDPGDPESVAAAVIVDGLADQDLAVVDVGVERVRAQPAAVTVRVAATHQPGAAGPSHTSVYELDLARDPDGGWRQVGARQLQ